MVPNKSGGIMTATAIDSRTGLPLAGGYGPAMAAKEALTRDLSAELAPHGIPVVGLRPQALPETRTIKEGEAEAGAERGTRRLPHLPPLPPPAPARPRPHT